MLKSFLKYGSLVGINLLYACVTISTKFASQQEMMSGKYLLGLGGAICVMGIYAILWQQIIKRMSVSFAYMFKGTALVWTMLFCYFIFGETITIKNIIGAIIIIAGITFYAWADKRVE